MDYLDYRRRPFDYTSFSQQPQHTDRAVHSQRLRATMSTQQPKLLRPSWDTLPTIFSTIQSYTLPVGWFYYLTFVSHILCKSDSAHVAKASLITFLRARPCVQMWHQALLSEIHDEDEPNLPSMLEGRDFLNPMIQKFQEYCTQRRALMTREDIFVARCVVVDFIYRHLDEAQTAAQIAKNAQTRNILEEIGVAVQQRELARQRFEASCLRFGSSEQELPAVGQIGVQDLVALLSALVLRSPFELGVKSENVFVSFEAPTDFETKERT